MLFLDMSYLNMVWLIINQFLQIHFMEDGTFEIYSRNAERNTGKYPDVALALSR